MPKIKRLKRIEDATMFIPLNEEGRSQWWSGSYKGDITACLRIDREDNYVPLGEEFRFERSDRSCNYSGEERVLVARGRKDNSVEIIAMDTIIGPDTVAVALPEKYGKIRELSREEMAKLVSLAARRERAGREGFAHAGFRVIMTLRIRVYDEDVGALEVGGAEWDREFYMRVRMGTAVSIVQRYLRKMTESALTAAKRAKRDGAEVTVKGSFYVMAGNYTELRDDVEIPEEVRSVQGKIRYVIRRVKDVAEPFFK